jgi:hypothetical protein
VRGAVVAVRGAVVLALAVGLTAGCSTGSATIRIDRGEDIVDRTVREIADRLDLDVQAEVPLSGRQRCQLPGGREGASNTVSLQGPLPDVDDPLGEGAAVLVDNDFELVADSGGPDLIFGRRDGMRITVDRGGVRLAIVGATGCRPLTD